MDTTLTDTYAAPSGISRPGEFLACPTCDQGVPPEFVDCPHCLRVARPTLDRAIRRGARVLAPTPLVAAAAALAVGLATSSVMNALIGAAAVSLLMLVAAAVVTEVVRRTPVPLRDSGDNAVRLAVLPPTHGIRAAVAAAQEARLLTNASVRESIDTRPTPEVADVHMIDLTVMPTHSIDDDAPEPLIIDVTDTYAPTDEPQLWTMTVELDTDTSDADTSDADTADADDTSVADARRRAA